MLDKARERLERMPAEARRRVTFVEGDGEHAAEVLQGRRFDTVLCHGVLGYLDDPESMVAELFRCIADGAWSRS